VAARSPLIFAWTGPARLAGPPTARRTAPGSRLEAHIGDWTDDDQPSRLNAPGMISVPYSVELNDLHLFGKGTAGPEFVQIVIRLRNGGPDSR
jgi:hypothetical protein